MRKTRGRIGCCLLVLLVVSGMTFAQAGQQTTTIVVNGQRGTVPMVQQNGRTYVDLAALAQTANASLSFKGNMIELTVPAGSASVPPAVETAKAADDSALTREFMKVSIEELASLREWGAAIAYVVDNGYPLQEQWAADHREQAASGLRAAGVAASTAGDKASLQLLTNEFEGVRQWSDRMVEASKKMDTAKYAMSPGSLRNEPQVQKLITCWHFLASMLGGGSFHDDYSCH